MHETNRKARLLMIAGFAAMVIGALDPLEGSLLILPGIGLLALGAHLGKNRQRGLLDWSFLLVAVGVGALWGFSAIGGFGGDTGRPFWWAIVLLPYPVGYVAGLVGGVRGLRESSTTSAPPGAQA
jgi:apolipoprotein N-acyltransferase